MLLLIANAVITSSYEELGDKYNVLQGMFYGLSAVMFFMLGSLTTGEQIEEKK